uniref:Plasma membrane proteolipid 3 n=1 Tax=Globisporangium ultimum (strain ATCC 200006 / CBS 805.95 / DAOM BR144) TaxID=431595 RepID=K3WXQ6_GLOUD
MVHHQGQGHATTATPTEPAVGGMHQDLEHGYWDESASPQHAKPNAAYYTPAASTPTAVAVPVEKENDDAALNKCAYVILAVLLPPLGVFFQTGCNKDFAINVLLTILGYLPGIIHALYVILTA